MAIETEWTADMVLALPEDGIRRELLDGELVVMPAPTLLHQNVVAELHQVLKQHVCEHRLGSVHMSPADIVFSPRRLVQPDVFVAPLVEGRTARSWTDIHALILAVEVTSPSTARYDRIKKRHIYMTEPVDEYWIVDLDARLVERWRRGDERPEIADDTIIWHPSAAIAALTIDLQAMFAAALT